MKTEYLLASKKCSECLFTPRRIVSGSRAADLMTSPDTHPFRCHKGDIAGQSVTCRGWHDVSGPSVAHRFAMCVGIPIREVDPDALEVVPC